MDLWLVAYEGETFAAYPTEEQALSAMFKGAAQRRRAGLEVAVVIAQVRDSLNEPEASFRLPTPETRSAVFRV
jgi:hypothetical protein